MLKCDLHTHCYESDGRDATAVVNAHRAAGYDCVALTEHF
jgi:predicted metal-dependent phosphoesterase TrpH